MDKLDGLRRWFQGPRGPFRSLASLLFLFLAIVAFHEWDASRPKPRVVTWNPSSPASAALVDGARPDPLRITFNDSAAKLEDIGKPVKKGVVLSPRIQGGWTWTGDSELTFTPSEDWPAGAEYTVRFAPAFFPKHLRPEKAAGTFRTPGFSASLASSEFHVDPKDPSLKRAAATFKFSHAVDTDSFEKALTVVELGPNKRGIIGSGNKLRRFTVSYDKFHGEAYVVSEPLGIPLEPYMLEIRAGRGIKPLRGGPPTGGDHVASVRVPGMYDYFRVEEADAALVRNERLEPEQVLIIRASGGVSEKNLAAALKVWLLPLDKPKIGRQEAVKNYGWRDPAEVGKEVIALSTPVALTPVPAEREHPAVHTFKLRAPQGRRLYARIPRGLVAYGGYVQAKEFDAITTLPAFPREIKILHEGALLRLSGDKKLSLYSLGESAVRLEVGRVRPGEINDLASQTAGDFSNPRFQGWSFGQDNITERFEEVRDFGKVEPDRLKFFSYDFAPRLQAPGSGTRNGLFFLRAEGWDIKNNRATCGADTRFLLITDLGVLIKENADRTRDVFVQSLADGSPVAGARVEAVGLNGVPVASAFTDGAGRARLPDFTGYTRERRPTAVVVRKDEDLAFLPFDRDDRRLDVSRFDVGGETTQGRERELSAYAFTDRGIYRPGETFHVGFFVRPMVWGQDLAGVPVEVSVHDPRGMEVKKFKLALSSAAFEAVEYRTQENGPTGSYSVSVYLVKDGRRAHLLGSTSARVEEFLPDRLRIDARFSREEAEGGGWVSPKELKASVSLRNLFGTPAENRRVAAGIRLTPAAPRFKDFADWSFHDPLEAKKSFSEALDDATTDADGSASFDMPLERFAEGTYRLELTAEGYEAEGGRGVVARAAVLVSPRPYLIGWKSDGALNYVTKGSSRSITAAAVGPDGRAVAASSIAVQLLEQRWVSAIVKGPDGLYRYQSVLKELFVSSRTLSFPAAPRSLRLDTSAPGDFALVLRDAAGVELNRARYSVAGHGNISRSLDKNAELQVRLEKSDYAPGSLIELQIKAPYAGAGLISIERDKVYAHKWFRSGVTASTQSIRLPEGVEGNAYVTVSFLRDPGSREIFMSPLSHGVAPFTVSRSRRTLPLTLEAPETMRPGTPCRVRVSAARRARVVVFAADEGILQVAGWTLPDPLAHFLRKRALEVRTYQILDLLLPEYRLSMALMAPGGDKGWDAAGKNLNPFKRKRDKPAVFWSGLFDVGPEGREIMIPVPDSFAGTLRITAVGAEPASIGTADRKVLVRQDIVLNPNAPLFVAPGDEFEASVAVANGVKGSGPGAAARVEAKTSGHLELVGEGVKTIPVGENRESVAVFRFKSRRSLGAATIAFETRISSETARRETSLSVRPPTPYMVRLKTGSLKKGRVASPTPRRMYPAYRTLEASLSPLPLGLAKGLLKYLQEYPYGCTEQLISQAFPALILRKRPEFGYAPKTVETSLAAAIDVLRSRQNDDGAFGMWASNSHVSPFQAVYAAHFMTMAKEQGYSIPAELLDRDLAYLNKVALAAPEAEAPPRVQAYAIYILTRNGRVTTPLIRTLRARLEKAEDKLWRKDLTGAYLAASYSLLHLDAEAQDLIGGVATGEPVLADWNWFYDGAIHEAQYVYLLALHFPKRLAALEADAILRVVGPLEQGSYNSLSSAYSILALDAYATAAGELRPGESRVEEVREDGGRAALVMPPGMFSKAEFTPAADAISIENLSERRLFWQTNQSGFDMEAPQEPVKSKLEVWREIVDEKGSPVTVAELGKDYTVRLRLRTLVGDHAPNLAVVDLVPGGFEPVWKEKSGESEGRAAPTTRMSVRTASSSSARRAAGRSNSTTRSRRPAAESSPSPRLRRVDVRPLLLRVRRARNDRGPMRRAPLAAAALAALAACFPLLRPEPLREGVAFSRAVYARDGRLLRVILAPDGRHRLWVPLHEMSPLLVEATVLNEDRRFRLHPGVDPASLTKAVWTTYVSRERRRGGSTITMQLARLRYGMDSSRPRGKALQILRALQLELFYTKDEILAAYLNLVPYGGNIEGAGAASFVYFGKDVGRLDLSEAITLSVIPQNPLRRTMTGGAKAAGRDLQEARKRLFKRWLAAHPEDAGRGAAIEAPWEVLARGALPVEAPHFARRALAATRDGRVVTTLDLDLQRLLERLVGRYVERRRDQGIRNAAAMLVDFTSMEVVAAVGSADWRDASIQGEVSALTARRSPARHSSRSRTRWPSSRD
ncbi:MAG: transglycosylase domain-containing protein [Elusimicrobiota bacterium]|nr:MAG: transglycosylase domain-containing protein [Elusimicrobiota bacterium]